MTVTYEISGAAGLICLDNPPVNATSHALRKGLLEALEALVNDRSVNVIALYGAGRAFIAGADIREFGTPTQNPSLPDVCLALEHCPKPVIAVVHGATLGGGLEVALSVHARVALPDLLTGFPEVTLGLLPGAGGTQRAPRVIGLPAALDLITTGRRIDADEALSLGLIDQMTSGNPRDAALRSAQDVLSGSLPTRRTHLLTASPDPAALDAATARMARLHPNLFSPHKCVEAVSFATGPITEGLAKERALFTQCINSPQRAGLIHAFFAERAVAKTPEAKATPRHVGTIGVVGGGTMGAGIAASALLAGLPVKLADRNAENLKKAHEIISEILAGAVKRGKLAQDACDMALDTALSLTLDLAEFAQTDLIIEAVFEDMHLKTGIFAQLDNICKPGAILATNTSYLDVNLIAAATRRPEDVIGLHFFSPAHVMRLLEVVVGEKTAPDVTTAGFALARKLGKVAVRAGVCDGFIGNRVLAHYRKVVDYMMLDGATPDQIDRALETFGFAMGPFAVSDLAGLDIGWATRKRHAVTRPAAERYVTIADTLCEAGWFGRKTGRGFYDHTDTARVLNSQVPNAPAPNGALPDILNAARQAAGIVPRHFSDTEIIDRYMTAMVSEAVRVLDDGIALRPIDIDAVFLFGYGFPRFRGGPLLYADTIGPDALIARIEQYAAEDPHYWQVPDLLREMARTGRSFADLNSAYAMEH
jgi:3-hydroxyacyl-CoA dehydrogenase